MSTKIPEARTYTASWVPTGLISQSDIWAAHKDQQKQAMGIFLKMAGSRVLCSLYMERKS